MAAAHNAVDIAASTLAEAVAEAELVVVATPVGSIAAQVTAALEGSAPDCTVTDVGSTKGRLCGALAGSDRFVGGHPMSGSETSGPRGATADLFDDATWFLTPLPETAPVRYSAVEDFVSSLGAAPVRIDADEHDRLLALVSHLPHALANLLMQQVGAARIEDRDPLAHAGASFRDMTRVAGANGRVWTDIFLDNAPALIAVLTDHRRRVERFESALREADQERLFQWIDEIAKLRTENQCF